MKVTETGIFKSNWTTLHFWHRWDDGCEVHYSTSGRIQDAQVTWGSNGTCAHREHRKGWAAGR